MTDQEADNTSVANNQRMSPCMARKYFFEGGFYTVPKSAQDFSAGGRVFDRILPETRQRQRILFQQFRGRAPFPCAESQFHEARLEFDWDSMLLSQLLGKSRTPAKR